LSDGSLQGAVRVGPVTAVPARGTVRLVPALGWRITQIVADFVTLFLAGMSTYGVYLLSGLGRQDYDPLLYGQLILVFSVVTVFALIGFGSYRNKMGLLRIEAVRGILLAVAAGLMLTLTLSFMLKFPAFSRLTLMMLGPVMIVSLVAERFMLWRLQDRVRALDRYAKPVLLYGAGATGRLLAQHLLEEHPLGLKPVGFLDDDPELRGRMVRIGPGVDGERVPVLGGEDKLERVLRDTGASVVFVAMPSASSGRIAELVARLESREIPYFFVPSAGDLMFSGLQFGQVAGIPVFTRRVQGANRAYEVAKRAIDISGASLLLLLSLPVLAVSTLLLKLTSPGPIFFTQNRCGLAGRPFTIFKLRTMKTDSPRYALHPSTPEDQRITGVGRWLRRFSIDELPQLWNVIRGQMSLVGPRPEMPGVVEQYDDIQRQRLAVKPGLTGLWQISADRAFRIHDNIQYDLYYVENRAVALDLAILLMTPFVLLGRNGAA